MSAILAYKRDTSTTGRGRGYRKPNICAIQVGDSQYVVKPEQHLAGGGGGGGAGGTNFE